MRKRDFPPVTPGEILEEDFLKPMGLSQYRLAKEIHVPPRRINEIVKGKRAITADTALRLGRYFGTTAQLWINLQGTYELECAEEALEPDGLPTPGCQLRLVDGEGRDCSVGEVGEIMINIPSATIGYWEDRKATAALFEDGWLHSGDLARFDEDGYFWFVGRKKLMIVRRGSNIAPSEIENVIDEHPAVHASVVVGVRDRRDGQIPVACVSLIDAGNSEAEEELPRHVAEHLAAYKCPAHYLFLEALPRTGTGKYDRQQLHALAQSRFGT